MHAAGPHLSRSSKPGNVVPISNIQRCFWRAGRGLGGEVKALRCQDWAYSWTKFKRRMRCLLLWRVGLRPVVCDARAGTMHRTPRCGYLDTGFFQVEEAPPFEMETWKWNPSPRGSYTNGIAVRPCQCPSLFAKECNVPGFPQLNYSACTMIPTRTPPADRPRIAVEGHESSSRLPWNTSTGKVPLEWSRRPGCPDMGHTMCLSSFFFGDETDHLTDSQPRITFVL